MIMTDNRRMTTDRFYGSITNRLENLHAMLEYVHDTNPSRSQLNSWLISNTQAGSEDAVNHHLTFFDSIGLIELSESGCELDEFGKQWLNDQSSETLYEALSSGVKGFDTLLMALQDGPMTDEDIMDLLDSEFEEAERTKPSPAIRHREWLQVLGYVERDDGINRLTVEGGNLLASIELRSEDMNSPKINTTDELSWLEAVRYELKRYKEEQGETVVTLRELYEFSEDRLATQFPDNKHIRAKIRQQLQYLRDNDEVEFLDEQGTYRIEVGSDIQEEKSELAREFDREPRLTEDTAQYTESQRRVRDYAFIELVREAYDSQCAICGSSRESPEGNPEVEAAHIYPKREGGSDDVRNGIALCKLHHWAFDSGWISLADDHSILVKEAPDRNGHHEFKQLEGRQIRLPEEEEALPHQMFLEEHRELHEFEQ